MNRFELDHIGYITDNIKATADAFEILGYQSSKVTNDDRQKTSICFLSKKGETKIELVEPYEENTTMQRMLKKRGVSPYHLCFTCNDVECLYEEMVKKNWTPLFHPVEAPAFNNRKICYFFKSEIGFIEFVNK